MKKFLASAATALLIATGGVALTTTAANATPPTEVCTPAEAWTETVIVTPEIPAVPAVPAVPEQAEVSHFDYQRYSWTGGPAETAPVEVPPSTNWQANTTNYEGAGKGDPVGVAFQGNGKADWFFWTKTKVVDKPYVAGTPEIPGVPAVPAVTKLVEHPAVTCDDPEGSTLEVITVSAVAICEEGLAQVTLTNPNEMLVYAEYSVFDAEGNDLFGDGFPLEGGESESSGSFAPEHFVEDAAYTVTTTYRGNIQDEPIEGPSTTFTVDCEGEQETFLPSCTTVTGSETIIGDGLISVEGNWDSSTIAVPFYGETLSDIGTVLDIQADPLPFVGLHIHTPNGTIVFEEEASYNGQLWSQNTWDGVEPGLGYPALGTIEEFIHFNGNVDVTGIDLLYTHPEASTTTVESFTIACTVYTFGEEEPPVVVEPEPETPVVVTPPVTEPAPTVTPTPTPSAVPAAAVVTADELAETGSTTMAPFLWFAGSVVVAGVIALAVARVLQRRRESQNTEQ